jgi:hypothetical protein
MQAVRAESQKERRRTTHGMDRPGFPSSVILWTLACLEVDQGGELAGLHPALLDVDQGGELAGSIVVRVHLATLPYRSNLVVKLNLAYRSFHFKPPQDPSHCLHAVDVLGKPIANSVNLSTGEQRRKSVHVSDARPLVYPARQPGKLFLCQLPQRNLVDTLNGMLQGKR